MTRDGLGTLKAIGFRPVGPWVVDVGRWSEITYLFRYDSLAERERLIAKFAATAEAKTFDTKVGELVDEITTRMLIPAPFPLKAPLPVAAPKPATSAVLPHHQQITPGVYGAGFAAQYRSANCGWVALGGETLLIDLPRGIPVPEFLTLVAATTAKPVRTLMRDPASRTGGIIQSYTPLIRKRNDSRLDLGCRRARAYSRPHVPLIPRGQHPAMADRTPIGDASVSVDFLPFDKISAPAGAAVWVPGQAVLFSGPLVVNGPRTSNT